MFFAPCTLPLVPAFLSVLGGTRTNVTNSQTLIINTVYFCLGFSLSFLIFGLFIRQITLWFVPNPDIINFIAGLFLVLLALILMGVLRTSLFTGFKTFSLPALFTPGTKSSSFAIGSAFSFGWSPCIGPVFATVLLLATTSSDWLYGSLLLIFFCLGFSLPFLLSAIFFTKLENLLQRYLWLSRTYNLLTGLVLLVFGVLLLVGQEGIILSYGTKLFYFLGLDIIFNYL